MEELHDPRVTELERLRASVDEALRHIDDFESQLKESPRRASIRNLMASEKNFTNSVPTRALELLPSEPAATQKEIENRFAAQVVACMSKCRAVV